MSDHTITTTDYPIDLDQAAKTFPQLKKDLADLMAHQKGYIEANARFREKFVSPGSPLLTNDKKWQTANRIHGLMRDDALIPQLQPYMEQNTDMAAVAFHILGLVLKK